jgi:hypothetical protein
MSAEMAVPAGGASGRVLVAAEKVLPPGPLPEPPPGSEQHIAAGRWEGPGKIDEQGPDGDVGGAQDPVGTGIEREECQQEVLGPMLAFGAGERELQQVAEPGVDGQQGRRHDRAEEQNATVAGERTQSGELQERQPPHVHVGTGRRLRRLQDRQGQVRTMTGVAERLQARQVRFRQPVPEPAHRRIRALVEEHLDRVRQAPSSACFHRRQRNPTGPARSGRSARRAAPAASPWAART